MVINARSVRRRRGSPCRRGFAAPALSGITLGGMLLVMSAGSASAHVHVEPSSTAAGSPTQLSFRVPSESEKAGTVKLHVELPQGSPFTDVSVQSMPGWTASVSTGSLPKPVIVQGAELTKAPRAVTWTANSKADAVPPEQYQYFTVSVSPLPAQGATMLFPATQTYSDGSVVHWNQKTPAGGAEPEHPAPLLNVTAAVPGDQGEADDATMVAQPGAPTTSSSAGIRAGSDATARWLGGAGLVLGGVALLVAGLRGRRSVRSES